METKLPIALSNRHIHLGQEDLDILFGKGYKLTKAKDLSCLITSCSRKVRAGFNVVRK